MTMTGTFHGSTASADLTAKLNALKAKAEAGKAEAAKAEGQLQQLRQQEEALVAEIRGLGLEPDQLDAEIARLDQEIASGIAAAEALLAGEQG